MASFFTSEIKWPYYMTSVISGLFYTSYSFYIHITMKFTLNYAYLLEKKEQLNHGITSME